MANPIEGVMEWALKTINIFDSKNYFMYGIIIALVVFIYVIFFNG